MPTHDIIDNHNEILIEHINDILTSSEKAKFAVGYFFLSGFTGIAERLASVKELRLLIGNTTNRETLEQLVEGCRRLDLAEEAAEAQAFPKRTQVKRMAGKTAANIRTSIEYMDQTDDGEFLIKEIAQMITEKRLIVKVYTKGRLHAKAYIFDYKPDGRYENGIAIIGSSNLSLAGLTHNTELNVVVQGNDNHEELSRWFEALWDDAQDFNEALMAELKQSWAAAVVKPYDIYMKTLYALVKDRLEGDDDREILWDDEIIRRLADFQKVAVRQAVQIIRDYGGAFVSDVVGLGKSYIGSAIIKHFERMDHARPLVICPASLVEMWERYNETYQLNAKVLSLGFLREDKEQPYNFLLDDALYRDRDFVLIDESHNFRNRDTQRYKLMQQFLSTGRRCCLLTATPRNKSAWDIYNQIKLFHPDDKTELPIDPPNLKRYFKLIDAGEKKLPDVLAQILVRRTRNHILRWYGFDSKTHEAVDSANFQAYLDGKKRAYVLVGGRHQFFPKRELETIEYSIEETYQGLYQQLRAYLGKPRLHGQPLEPQADELTYARYGLWHYLKSNKRDLEQYLDLKRSGPSLRGLMRILLFKRFESSVAAFRVSIERLLKIHRQFISALNEGIVPAGDEAQSILYESDIEDMPDLVDALAAATEKYKIDDFDIERLEKHINHDIGILKGIYHLVDKITPDEDAKLQRLLALLSSKSVVGGKCLIFTQYADTAKYLYENLNPDNRRADIDVIFSGDKSKVKVVGRFAPKANPEYRFTKGEIELNILVATDVLAEGLNLQDCDKIINYDLHWNPVRLIQRFGRIDRIGSDHDIIYGYNFLPEIGLDKHLGLRQTLHNRIQEIHDTIGEDAAILDNSEQLNVEAMYAIYENKGELSSIGEDEGEFIDLNEAEELLRQLRKDNPEEYERIANLRDGIRTAAKLKTAGLYVFCQAGRYQQLFLLDSQGDIISRDIPKVLAAIKCGPDIEGSRLPKGFNQAVMKVKRKFAEEVKHQYAERAYSLQLTHGQRYVVRELKLIYGQETDDDKKSDINILEKAFRGTLNAAIKKELNLIRRNSISGPELFKKLLEIYTQFGLKEQSEGRHIGDDKPVPRIICSEALE